MVGLAGATQAPPPDVPADPPYKRVYLWHWPIRTMHWLAAVSLVALMVTGFYIGAPYFMTSGEASSHYLMGWMRFLHFGAAGVLVATGIVRVYWLLVGNRYERFTALVPVRRRDWANLWKLVQYYLLVRHERPWYLGHNPLQQLSYTALYGLALFQVVTGFALYGMSNPGGFFFGTFAWVPALFGGIQVVRFFHHIATWIFIAFIPVHIYLSLRTEVVDHEAIVSSIISGNRFVRSDVEFADE